MGDVLSWAGGGLVIVGVALSVLGAVGVLRFPDFYTRIHAASITDTGGASLVLLGLCLIAGFSLVTLKLVFVWVFVMLTTPVAANAARVLRKACLRMRVSETRLAMRPMMPLGQPATST